jgi:hypothetical protein
MNEGWISRYHPRDVVPLFSDQASRIQKQSSSRLIEDNSMPVPVIKCVKSGASWRVYVDILHSVLTLPLFEGQVMRHGKGKSHQAGGTCSDWDGM